MKIEEVEVELTSICNAKCQLCYRNYKSYQPAKVVRPLADVIEQLKTYEHLKRIKLVGVESEPTLYPHFHEFVTWLKDNNIQIEICTNGDTNNPAWWEQLGNILKEEDEVYFTVCGSTQELHETYRRNTKLENILRNAAAMRKAGKANDYAQCIRFEYNNEDFNSDAFKEMVSEFSHVYWTETYLHKDLDNYVDTDGMEKLTPPADKINEYLRIERLADALYKSGGSRETTCIAVQSSSVQIDVYGKVYPCYLHKEAGIEWDGTWDKIHKGESEVCKLCNKTVRALCHEKGLQYII